MKIFIRENRFDFNIQLIIPIIYKIISACIASKIKSMFIQ